MVGIARPPHGLPPMQRGAGVKVDEAQAAALFRQAADDGHVPALEQYALCLKHGRGCTRDVPAAIQRLSEGVEQQDAGCEYQLALVRGSEFYLFVCILCALFLDAALTRQLLCCHLKHW